MNKNIAYSFAFLLCLLSFVTGCKNDELTGDSNVPFIKMVGVSATSVLQFKDSLAIIIEYADGDGDIGATNPDQNDIQIKDKRLSKADYYFIKPLSPPGTTIKTKGTIAIQMKNVFLLGTANSETTTFEVKLRDRAGNWSNSVFTPTITITK
ncbi:MAG: hypothetical protein V4613_10645 [Bacteroidota bacterium]